MKVKDFIYFLNKEVLIAFIDGCPSQIVCVTNNKSNVIEQFLDREIYSISDRDETDYFKNKEIKWNATIYINLKTKSEETERKETEE